MLCFLSFFQSIVFSSSSSPRNSTRPKYNAYFAPSALGSTCNQPRKRPTALFPEVDGGALVQQVLHHVVVSSFGRRGQRRSFCAGKKKKRRFMTRSASFYGVSLPSDSRVALWRFPRVSVYFTPRREALPRPPSPQRTREVGRGFGSSAPVGAHLPRTRRCSPPPRGPRSRPPGRRPRPRSGDLQEGSGLEDKAGRAHG